MEWKKGACSHMAYLKNKGQIAILLALLMPIFLLMLGIALDLGWYYLNVSRLQNAADAAAIAGAQEILEDKTNFSDYKVISLISKYPAKVSNEYRTANAAELETIVAGEKMALTYVNKNLSGNSGITTDSWTKEKVETAHKLYEKDDNLYFVVQLREEIKHFFLPGWFDDMNAPVTSVARISKKVFAPEEDPDMPSKPGSTDTPTTPTKPDAPDKPDTTDSPVVDDVSKALVLTFNANGGTLDDADAITKDIILKTDSSGNVTVTLSQTAEREGYTFTGWNTSPDGSGTSYPNGSVINQNDFNGSKTLTLYAQWENSNPTTNPDNPESIPTQEESYNPEDDTDPIDTPPPTNEETQKEITAIDEGISIYGAMKGNYTGTTNTKGLEEMTTYNTWWATYNKLGSNYIYSPNDKNSDGTAQGQGTRYDPSKPYREEKLYIDSTTKQDKSFIFFDLGSDIMYVDHHPGNTTVKNKNGTIMARHNWGGLFKYSWDSSNVQNSAVVFDSLYSHANSYTYTSKGSTTTYNCLDGTNNYGTNNYTGNYYEFKYNFYNTSGKEVDYSSGEKGIRYRVHTTIDIKNIWPVRQNKSALNSSYASRVISDADPLYIRIESEELNEADHDRQNTTARQMFINVKADNTGSNARPLVIFYEGPDRGLTEGFDDADVTNNQSKSPKENYPNLTRRPSQPVVLNLQADFKGILFAPSSPVVILGNGHKMLGFVIAKEFVQLDTSSGTSVTRDGITFCVDSWGNLKTKALPATSRRRPTYAETPTGQTYDEYLTTYYSTFIDFKKKYFVDYEYVYLRSAFNLSLDSYYDSFKIPELERKIYLYLEKYKINAPSVDMFFTTVRSKWIT